MREQPERRCNGQESMFLSTHPTDHGHARELCGVCPAFDWCLRETVKALSNESYGLGVEGTWAGVLYKNGRVVTSMDKRGRRPVVTA